MSDLRDTITNAAKTATKTTGGLLKTAKLNMNLSSAEGKIKTIYMEIGTEVHNIYKNGGSIGEFFDGKYIEILAAEEKIAEIKEQLSIIKGIRVCTKCGKTAERTSEFCPKCGLRFEPEPEEEENCEDAPATDDRQYAPPPPTKICRVCNASNDASQKFCLSCGRSLLM